MRSQESVLKEIDALHDSFKHDVVKVLNQPDVTAQQVGISLLAIISGSMLNISESALKGEGTPEDVLDFAIKTLTGLYNIKRSVYKLQQTP